MPLTASQPFVFTGCVEVRQALDHRATDERELLERLEEVPAGSVFYHTHGYFLRQRAITTVYGNDFASWVATQVRDQVLAERSEEHTSELQSPCNLVCRLLLEKKKT